MAYNPSSTSQEERKNLGIPQGVAQVSGNTESPTALLHKAKRGKNRHVTLEQVYDIENLKAAEREAKKGKRTKYGVVKFNRKYEENILKLHNDIKNRTYHTSPPRFEEYHDKKDRILCKIDYYDHVAHHALMRVIMPTLMKYYYQEASASIKGRGIHYSAKHVKSFIAKHKNTPMWWAQLDFVKFYHHIKRQKMYDFLCGLFDDEGIRYMLHDVIWSMGDSNGLTMEGDGTEGMGIGEYPTQLLEGAYTSPLCRKLTSMGVKVYIYCDNILIIGFNPKNVWEAIRYTQYYAKEVMDQPLHTNVGVMRLDDRHPIDFVGYKFYLNKTFVRDDLKIRFIRATKTEDPKARAKKLSAYKGWLMHCNGHKLWQKYTGMKSFSELNIKLDDVLVDGKRFFNAPSVPASFIVDQEIVIKDFEANCTTQNGEGRMWILIENAGRECKFCTNNQRLKDIMFAVRDANEFPFTARLRKRNVSGNKVEYFLE